MSLGGSLKLPLTEPLMIYPKATVHAHGSRPRERRWRIDSTGVLMERTAVLGGSQRIPIGGWLMELFVARDYIQGFPSWCIRTGWDCLV